MTFCTSQTTSSTLSTAIKISFPQKIHKVFNNERAQGKSLSNKLGQRTKKLWIKVYEHSGNFDINHFLKTSYRNIVHITVVFYTWPHDQENSGLKFTE